MRTENRLSPTTDIVLRDAQRFDLGEVGDIYRHYVATTSVTFDVEPPTLEAWEERFDYLQSGGLPFLVASAEERIVGYAYVSPWKERCAYRTTIEDSIYVAPTHLGQGVGRKLLSTLIEQCIQREFLELIAVIAETEDAEASKMLHCRLGFLEVGCLKRVGYKFDRWVDTSIFQLSLRS